MGMTGTNERTAIRRLMRQRRRVLSDAERAESAALLYRNLLRLPHYRKASRIAAYLAVQGEIELDAFINTAWNAGKSIYLPRLRNQRMEFHRYTTSTRMIENRFGIPEPEVSADSRINVRFLDLVLAPMVAFDDQGGRLGTGGGFYDRTFEFMRHRVHWQRPALLAVAYEFQRVPALPMEPWDIPVHGVVTDACTRFFTP